MWFKLENESYFNIDNSVLLGASGTSDAGFHVEVVTPHTGGTGRKLRSGYADRQEAQGALDSFMVEVGYESIPGPEIDGFDMDDEESEEELAPAYEDLSVEDLKAQCSHREPPLSTAGKKSDLIQRLREDDEIRAAAEEL